MEKDCGRERCGPTEGAEMEEMEKQVEYKQTLTESEHCVVDDSVSVPSSLQLQDVSVSATSREE